MSTLDMPSLGLDGRTVLITGASSGLGRRFARLAAGAGARVACVARREDHLRSLEREIREAGGQALALVADVTTEASIGSAFDAAERHWGTIDSVVANAGINMRGRSVELSAEAFDAVFAVNVRGAFLTVREAARRMIAGDDRRNEGRIVLVSSIGGHTVLPGLAAYCSSKAAVLMLGKALAREWARQRINVNVLCPGYIESDLNAQWFRSEGGRQHIASFHRRRLMAEEDLDAIVLHLLSDSAKGITGSVFTLDDGQSL